ncbi:hypothetical protein EJB05_00615, partial [Eragrostis curvula]
MAAAASPMLPALLLFFTAFAAATAGAAETTTTTALDETCAFLGGWYVTPELCASVLCSDASASAPCRAARDAPAVAALAARLAARNATATKGSVEAALAAARARAAGNVTSAAGAAEVARGIDSCLQLYAGVVPALQWAAESVAAGRYRGARQVLDAAQYVPGGCEGMAGDAAALPRENSAFSYVAMVAHAVVASMVRD